MVTTTMRVLHWIHAATAHPGPTIALHTVLVVLLPAFRIGLSKRPPPAVMPITARQVEETDFLEPDGKRILVFLPSSEWPTIMQEVPEPRAMRPRSPAFSSHIDMTVPSGILFKGNTLPMVSSH